MLHKFTSQLDHLIEEQGERFPGILTAALVIIIGLAFFRFVQTTPDVSDSIGYIVAAEGLVSGQGLAYEDPNNRLAEPFFFLYSFKVQRSNDTRLFFSYPPGFPLLLTLPIMLTGTTQAAHYVVPILAIMTIPFLFLLGKLLSGDVWVGFWTAALVSLAPVFMQFGTATWSDVPSMVFLVAGVCFYILSRQANRPTRQIVILSITGGLLVCFSLFIRQANLAIVPALALFEVVDGRSAVWKDQRRLIFFLTLISGLALFFVFNHLYFGGFFTTGYSPDHGWYPQPAFSLEYALGPSFANGYSLLGLVESLWRNFHFLLFLVPIGWILLPAAPRILVIAVTFLSLAPYAIYAFSPEGINSRFLMPAVPFLGVAIAQSMVGAGKWLPNRMWRFAGALLVLTVLLIPVPAQVEKLQERNAGTAANARRVMTITEPTAPEAVFLTYTLNDHVAYYGDRSVLNYRHIPPSDPEAGRYRTEVVEPCLVQSVTRLLAEGKPVYYINDTSPPLWDSLAILERYFTLRIVQEGLEVFEISPPSMPIDLEALGPCKP
jgi:hypothetical protein